MKVVPEVLHEFQKFDLISFLSFVGKRSMSLSPRRQFRVPGDEIPNNMNSLRRRLPKIRRLPPIHLSDNLSDENNMKNDSIGDCVICMEKITEDDMLKSKCKHYFCGSCILSNVASGNNKCPLCRTELCKSIDLTPSLNIDTGYYIVETVLRKTKLNSNRRAITNNDMLKFGMLMAHYLSVWLEEGKERLIVPNGYYFAG